MKPKPRKKPQTTARKGKPAPERMVVYADSGYPFYAWTQGTAPLTTLAHYAQNLEDLKQRWEQNLGGLSTDDELVFMRNPENFDFLKESWMLRLLTQHLVKGNVGAVQRFAQFYSDYEDGGRNLGNKDMAKVCLMIACDTLWAEGHERPSVTKGQLEQKAKEIWATWLCRGKKKKPTRENIDQEVSNLPVVDWPLVRREIALHDIPEAKRGRKPK